MLGCVFVCYVSTCSCPVGMDLFDGSVMCKGVFLFMFQPVVVLWVWSYVRVLLCVRVCFCLLCFSL